MWRHSHVAQVQSIVLKMENYGPANPFDSVCKLQKIAKRAGGSKENLEWCFQILQDFWEAGYYAEDKFADRALDGKQPRCDGKGTVDLLVAKQQVLVYLTGELLDSLFKDDDKAVIRNTCRCVESFREKCGYINAPQHRKATAFALERKTGQSQKNAFFSF